tara:strand:- start:884 stop:1162 length:279 start_codon:yes stop_codon:yes gene_type:complete
MKIKLNKGTKIAGLIGAGVFVAFFNIIAATVLVKFGWEKISMIIFPGLVDEGAVNAFLSYKDAFVIAFIIYIFKQALGAGVATINNDEDNKK